MKKRPDGRYKVSLTIDGKRHWFYGRTKKDAEQRREQFKNTIQAAPNVDYNVTLGQWLSIWLRGARATLAADTYESYVYQLRRYVLPTMAKIKLVNLQPHMFRKLIADLLDRGYSNRSVQYALAVVRIGLNQAVNDGVLPVSPMRGVKLPQKQKTQVSALSKDEAQRLLGVISNPCHYNLYYVALHTGLRRSELLGLRIRDVNTEASTISVNQTVLLINGKPVISPTTKNAASRRTISVDAKTMSILRRQIMWTLKNRMSASDYEDTGLLFCRRDGRPYDPKYISHTANKYGKLAGFHLTFHMLRHTHATLLLKAGVHFKVVQVRLGHSSFQQTMDTYSHVLPDIEEQVVDKLIDLI